MKSSGYLPCLVWQKQIIRLKNVLYPYEGTANQLKEDIKAGIPKAPSVNVNDFQLPPIQHFEGHR